MRLSRHFKTISQILILAMLHLCWLTSYGYAEMIPTESTIEQPSQDETDRQRILDLLGRQEVIDELEKYDISKEEATVRINSLTNEEVMKIAGKLDELPAGGVCIRSGGTSSPGCEESNDDALVYGIIIGLVLLFVLFFYWIRGKNKVDYPSSNEGTVSEPIEEVCDPGMESCPGI